MLHNGSALPDLPIGTVVRCAGRMRTADNWVLPPDQLYVVLLPAEPGLVSIAVLGQHPSGPTTRRIYTDVPRGYLSPVTCTLTVERVHHTPAQQVAWAATELNARPRRPAEMGEGRL